MAENFPPASVWSTNLVPTSQSKKDRENNNLKEKDGGEFDLRNYCSVLYDKAGSLVQEQDEQITLEKYGHLLNDKVGVFLQQVLGRIPSSI